MARVEWSRTSPDDVEAVLAVMLCRQNPNAIRIRPSQGDGGVDIYVSQNDSHVIYQVKGFTGRLDANRKRQIKKSWDTFKTFIADRGMKIEEWNLVRPENPTWQDEDWLKELTAGADFPCRWKGETFCDALAADHPSVIDYYLRDGRERLQETLKELLAAASGLLSQSDLTKPSGTVDSLTALHAAVNEHDPHFYYDFSVDSMSAGQMPPVESYPGMVAAASYGNGERAVTFRIFARYQGATEDRPVPGSFTLVAEPGSPEAAAIKDFAEYGLPLTGVTASSLELDLPGGFGAAEGEGIVHLGPARRESAQTLDLQLVLLDPSDRELVTVDLDMEPPTTGLDGNKFAVSGHEKFGVFEMQLRFDPGKSTQNLTITCNDITGKAPADVIGGLTALKCFGPPNRFFLKLRNGPALDDPKDIPASLDGDANPLLTICEALATIQEHTFLSIVVPDLTKALKSEAEEWVKIASLLRGEEVKFTWNEMKVTLNEGATLPATADDDAFAVAVPLDLTANIGSLSVPLGVQLVHLPSARIHPDDVAKVGSSTVEVRIVPARDVNSGTARWFERMPEGAGPETADSSAFDLK